MNKDIRIAPYFPGQFQLGGVVLIGGAVYTATDGNYIVAAILILLAVVVFTTWYRLGIDLTNKTYHEYISVLGMKFGEKKKFETVEYILIRENRVSQTMRLRVAATTVKKDVYDAYVKFSEQEKVHIRTAEKKEKLIAAVTPIASSLGVKIVDHSS